MACHAEITDAKATITVEGDLDTEEAAKELSSTINDLYNDGVEYMVLDLSAVQVINSHGIGKLVMLYKKLRDEGKTLKVKPLSGFVKETFELLMLDKLIPVEE